MENQTPSQTTFDQEGSSNSSTEIGTDQQFFNKAQGKSETFPPSQDTPNKPKPKPYLIFILTLLFLAISSTLIYFVYQKNLSTKQTEETPQNPSSPQTTQLSPTPDPTADWKTYINDKYLLSFIYPNTWNVNLKEEDKQFSSDSMKIVEITISGDNTVLKINAVSFGGGTPCVLENQEKTIMMKDGQFVSREINPILDSSETLSLALCGGKDCHNPGSVGEFTGVEYNCYTPVLSNYFKGLPGLQSLTCSFSTQPSQEVLEKVDKIIASFENTNQ